MTKKANTQTSKFEAAFQAISLATWNRPRSTVELQSFIDRREALISDAEA